MNIKVKTDINIKDLVIGQFMIGIKSLSLNLIFIISSLVIAYSEIYIEAKTENKTFLSFIGFAVMFYILTQIIVNLFSFFKFKFGDTKGLTGKQELFFDELELTETTEYNKSKYSYILMTKVFVSFDTIYIGFPPGQYHLVPKCSFKDEAEFNKLFDFLKMKVKANKDNN